MNRKTKSRVLAALLLSLTFSTRMPVKAAESEMSVNKIATDVCFNLTDTESKEMVRENTGARLFEKKYKISVDKVYMRSGPGTSYSVEGTLYKNDVLYVKSISNGWAKFEVNGQWRYVPENAIVKM